MAEQKTDPGSGGYTPPASSGSSGGATPTLKPPAIAPPTKKSSTSEGFYFNEFMKAHPVMNKYRTAIWSAANRYGAITPTELAAVLFAESGGNPTATSSAGAEGLAQIFDHSANPTNAAGIPFFRQGNFVITEADKRDPAFSILYAAWRLSGQKAAHPDTIDNVWIDGYNPNYRSQKGYNPHYITQYLPKGYQGTGTSTAGDTAGKTGDITAVEQGIKNPYVVGVSKTGKLITKNSPTVPTNVVVYDGSPMQVSDWHTLSRQLESFFVSYTGGRPNNKVLLSYVQKGWGPYSLTAALSKLKGFTNSPIYKRSAPALQEAAKSVTANGSAISPNLLRQAVVNGWSGQELQAVLRTHPDYVQSNEFKTNTATLLNVHQSIMGLPDTQALNGLKQAALAGWSTDQYAAYLRSSPQYTSSPEYQSKTLSFLTNLGLITGKQPILRTDVAPDTNTIPNTSGALPNDPRLKGKTGLSNPEDSVATYG